MPLVMAMNPRPAILRRLGRDGSEITIKTLVQDRESSDSIAQLALQNPWESGLDRIPTRNESLTFAQLYYSYRRFPQSSSGSPLHRGLVRESWHRAARKLRVSCVSMGRSS